MGIMTFSRTVNSSIRKWNWKTKPMCSPRAAVRTASWLFDISRPLIQISPESGWSRSPRRYRSVDLPHPDGPTIA